MSQQDINYGIYLVLSYIWNIFIITSSTYLIFFKGVSPWWYILVVLLLGRVRNKKEINGEV